MTIAELFVNIGVKGADTSKKAVVGVKESIGEVASESLAAKAAILGVIYGLERLTMGAAAQGQDLRKFADATGLSVVELQKWQYAARQFGVSGEEVTGTLQGLQGLMTNMLMGKGAPEGMGLVARMVGFDPNKARDTFYVLSKLQEFAKIAPPDVAASVLKSFNINPNMFQFLRTNNVDMNKIKPSNIYSAGEISTLAKVDTAWSNLWAKLKMIGGHEAAQHGLFFVGELGHAVNQIAKMVASLDKLIEKAPGIVKVGAALLTVAAVAGPFGQIGAAIVALTTFLGEMDKHQSDKSGFWYWMNKKDLDKDVGGFFTDMFKKKPGEEAAPLVGGAPGVPLPPSVMNQTGAQNSTTVNSTINVNGNIDQPHQMNDHVKKQIQDALQSPSLSRVK